MTSEEAEQEQENLFPDGFNSNYLKVYYDMNFKKFNVAAEGAAPTGMGANRPGKSPSFAVPPTAPVAPSSPPVPPEQQTCVRTTPVSRPELVVIASDGKGEVPLARVSSKKPSESRPKHHKKALAEKEKRPAEDQVQSSEPKRLRDPRLMSLPVEQIWYEMGCRLKDLGQIGVKMGNRLLEGWDDAVARLEGMLKVATDEAKAQSSKNKEMALVLASQSHEMTRLAYLAGVKEAENAQLTEEGTRLKEENLQLLDEVSQLRSELAQRKENFPAEAATWAEEHKLEVARRFLHTREATKEFFQLLYREENGREMITAVGSYGFMCGQKEERAETQGILASWDPEFVPETYGLAPVPEEVPTPPFPLD